MDLTSLGIPDPQLQKAKLKILRLLQLFRTCKIVISMDGGNHYHEGDNYYHEEGNHYHGGGNY